MATLALARMHTADIARHANIGQKIWTSPKIISAKLKNFVVQKANKIKHSLHQKQQIKDIALHQKKQVKLRYSLHQKQQIKDMRLTKSNKSN